MAHSTSSLGIVSGRLNDDLLNKNFEDLHAPLSNHEALIFMLLCLNMKH